MKIDIPIEVLQSMKKIIDYNIENEKDHYAELESEEGLVEANLLLTHHIYHDYELVNRFLLSQDLQAEIDKDQRKLKQIERLEDEENDLKALSYFRDILREERNDRAGIYMDALAEKGFAITEIKERGVFLIELTKYGPIDYYPKANKIHIKNENSWIGAGIHWIIKNLLDNQIPEG